ncbi:MAG: hypothetical protein GKS04_01135 [Candidatus Mycalebacterium zealandia]|nr:MAG: hypothetical protein GKS04_01135 [Candidatus Mycalebacterium zealandia]
MSTKARYIENATYKSASATQQDDNIFFVDTTLRVTPQLVLSDTVTIRAQVDILDNNIWGGQTDQLLGGGSTLVNSGISASDKFRGTILHGNTSTNCLTFGNFCAVEQDAGFFNVRMLHADIVLPNNLGFVRIGRQPFDWGLGILANGGWDPHSDGGFLVDRFLWLKGFSLAPDVSLTAIFVSDRITQGTGLNTGSGDGWDGGAVAFVLNHANMGGINATFGAYVFPYIHQDAFIGGFGDLDRFTLYSGLIDLKGDSWKLTGELQGGFGEITNILGAADSKIKNALLFAVRGEYMAPTIEYLNVIGAEFGWADGDKNDGSWIAGDDIEGGVIVFNPAYNLDNLLFKHVMPSIYQDANSNILARADASVQNAYYTRVYADIPVSPRVSFKPQILVAWNQETSGLIGDGAVVGSVENAFSDAVSGATYGEDDSSGEGATGRKTVTATQPNSDANSYLGTEVEGTVTVEIYPGVNLDIIGSLMVAGEGLTDLLEAQAFARDNAVAGTAELADADGVAGAINTGQKAEDILWGVQTRLVVYIDEFFKS